MLPLECDEKYFSEFLLYVCFRVIMPPVLVEWYVDKLKNSRTPPKEIDAHSVGVDSRFPNQNQTRYFVLLMCICLVHKFPKHNSI